MLIFFWLNQPTTVTPEEEPQRGGGYGYAEPEIDYEEELLILMLAV
jgi:hypothetical protein